MVRGWSSHVSRPNCVTWHHHAGADIEINFSNYTLVKSPKEHKKGTITITHTGTVLKKIEASTLNVWYAVSADRRVQDGAYVYLEFYDGVYGVGGRKVKICKGGCVGCPHFSASDAEPIVAD